MVMMMMTISVASSLVSDGCFNFVLKAQLYRYQRKISRPRYGFRSAANFVTARAVSSNFSPNEFSARQIPLSTTG
jgi:hypothetical protein